MSRGSDAGEEDGPRQRFEKLASRVESLGVPAERLHGLESVQGLRQGGGGRRWVWRWLRPALLGWAGVQTLCLMVWVLQWPVSRQDMVGMWFSMQGLSSDNEQCLVDVADMVQDISRPPVDCVICRGVTQVDRVSKLTQDEFEATYAYSGRPVVITDATDKWGATDKFSFDFFKNVYPEDSPALQNIEHHCQFFPYRTNFGSLAEVFNMSTERANLKDGSEPWYIGWSNCDYSATNTLRQYYSRPYFLPRVAESSQTDWIFMGSPGYGAHMHIDNVGNPSWQAQITGFKLWTLEPPPECYLECEPSITVTVHPGEIIVLDTNQWYHSTLNVGKDISITIGSEFD